MQAVDHPVPVDRTDGEQGTRAGAAVFAVRLANFNGPFDLLLTLISRRELDITEVALAQVTDEFIAHIRHIQRTEGEWKLDEASEFLVVAATLLDLKAARLLPTGSVEDEEDIALLEARDLLFARLLQYRAFKEMARQLGERLAEEDTRHARSVPLEPEFTGLLPDLVWKHSPEEFAALAAKALGPRPEVSSEVSIEHLHAPPLSVREQAVLLKGLLRGRGSVSFRYLTEDTGSRLMLVVRFLALLELFRDGAISFDQAAPLGELRVRWNAGSDAWSAAALTSDFEDDGDIPGDIPGDVRGDIPGDGPGAVSGSVDEEQKNDGGAVRADD